MCRQAHSYYELYIQHKEIFATQQTHTHIDIRLFTNVMNRQGQLIRFDLRLTTSDETWKLALVTTRRGINTDTHICRRCRQTYTYIDNAHSHTHTHTYMYRFICNPWVDLEHYTWFYIICCCYLLYVGMLSNWIFFLLFLHKKKKWIKHCIVLDVKCVQRSLCPCMGL